VLLETKRIAEAVHDAILTASVELRHDVFAALQRAAESERFPRGRWALEQLLQNAEIAVADRVPLCQDTGSVWVWVELGEKTCLTEPLKPAIDAAVATAYREGLLRMSVVRDALFDRANTSDNTPALLDVTLRPGEGATVHVMLKGGGSDNASALKMLAPTAGLDGVREAVLDAVRATARSACPPLFVGVGVGGGFDQAAKLSKQALLRPIGQDCADPERTAFEELLLREINATGIGPAGLGGDTTALAVHVKTAPCHIASLPVAINMGCYAIRSASVCLSQ